MYFPMKDIALVFPHNDLPSSTIIVQDDKIVVVIDWERSGFFGESTAEVIALNKSEDLNLSEEELNDLAFGVICTIRSRDKHLLSTILYIFCFRRHNQSIVNEHKI